MHESTKYAIAGIITGIIAIIITIVLYVLMFVVPPSNPLTIVPIAIGLGIFVVLVVLVGIYNSIIGLTKERSVICYISLGLNLVLLLLLLILLVSVI